VSEAAVTAAMPPSESELSRVAAALEEDIIFGRLSPGQRLIEDVLMARFSATRHVIRQALGELQRTGIVIRERNIGAAVRSYAREEVLQIYEVREFLQRQAALMIALPAPESLIRQLKALNEAYRAAAASGDLRAVHEANDAFHLTLFNACGNQYLTGSIKHYMNLSLPMRAKTLAEPEAFKVSQRHHAIMIELLQENDKWALAQICADHVQPSKRDYLKRADEQAAPSMQTETAGND
jgi:DNA-binding GntR family transcriptional regulator